MDYTCAECGQKFAAARKRRYCTPRCKTDRRSRIDRAQTCATLGITAAMPCHACGTVFTYDPRRTKGRRYCSLRCKPGLRGTMQKTCLRCGSEFTTRRHANAPDYCSDTCRGRTDSATRRRQAALEKAARAAAGTVGSDNRIYIAGNCTICAGPYCMYVAGSRRTYRRWCSPQCRTEHLKINERSARRKAKANRRARKRNAFVATVDPLKVFAADGWRCHLCGKAVKRDAQVPHPKAPTVDHVIPLAKGGTHEPANCRTAHFLCNSLKGARGGGQLALTA